MANFEKSKSIGKFGENLISNYFKLANIECNPNSEHDKSDYDLTCKMGRTKFTVEVKLDWLAAKTGNIAIETGNPQKNTETGIYVTKADLWGVLVKDEENWVIFLTSVKRLKEYIEKNPGREIVGAGDGNATIQLHKMTDISHIFRRIDNIGKLVNGNMDYSDMQKVVKELLK